MAVDFTSSAILFTPPIIILWCAQRITARLWVAIYLASILPIAVVVNTEASRLWFLSLGVSILSTGFLIVFTALLSPPGQRVILMPFLTYTERDPGGVGIDEEQTYDPSTVGKEIDIDIIAVNGLGAHPMRTWMAKDASQPPGTYVSWLKKLLPDDFQHARIMSFQQDTSYLVNAPVKTIDECGGELLSGIEPKRKGMEEKHRPILFIGHSFGGIVVKEALVQAKEKTHPAHAIFKSTIGILFLGTPHNGAWSAALGDIIIDCTSSLGSNRKIMDDLRYQSKKLTELQRDFEECYKGGIISIYEARRTRMGGILPIMVVDEKLAAIRNEHEHPIKLNTDHSGLNKFGSRDGNYITVVTKIGKLIDVYYKIDDGRIDECLRALQVSTSASGCAPKRRDLPRDLDRKTCSWVEARVDEFCGTDTSPRALIFRGSPGSGKSVISRYIMDYLETKEKKMVYFTFKDDSWGTSHAEPAMRMLIRQMLDKDHRLYRHVRNHHNNVCSGGSWSLEVLLQAFRDMISDVKSRSVVIVLDALNECNDQSRRDLLDGLAPPRLLAGRFIITTQDVPELTDAFPESTLVELDNLKDVKDAVRIFINQKVDEFFNELRKKATGPARQRVSGEPYQQLRDHMLATLNKNAGHMFLWVYLVMKRLRDIKNSAPENIRAELDALPPNLILVYEKIFQQISKEGPAEVARKLPWILYAQRPLTVEELRDALAIQDCKGPENEGRSFDGCRSDVVEDDLRKTFGSLVTVEGQTREIQLFHQTLRGALLGMSKPPSEILRGLCRNAKEEHADIAATCLDYLSLETFDAKAPDHWRSFRHGRSLRSIQLARYPGWRRFEDLEFLEYAAQMWPHHAQQAGEENKKILKKFDALAALPHNMELAFQIFTDGLGLEMGKNMPITYMLCCFGLEKLAIKSLPEPGTERCQDLEKRTARNEHLLHSAAYSGCRELLSLLLNRYSADLWVKDEVDQTMMHYAAQGGQRNMVEYLMSSGLSFSDPGRSRLTPLHYAAYGHHLDVIKLLLEHDASRQATDSGGLTPRQYLHLYKSKDCHDPRCRDIASNLEAKTEGQ